MCTPLTFQVRLKERVPRSLRSCLGPACGAWVRAPRPPQEWPWSHKCKSNLEAGRRVRSLGFPF